MSILPSRAEGKDAGMLELQLRKKIELVEQEITALLVDDPTMYYEGDFDELWDTRENLVAHLARFHPRET